MPSGTTKGCKNHLPLDGGGLGWGWLPWRSPLGPPTQPPPARGGGDPGGARRPGLAGPYELLPRPPPRCAEGGVLEGEACLPLPFHLSDPCLPTPRRDEKEPGRSA